MKIETYKINPKLNLKISGDESWLTSMISELDSARTQPNLLVCGEVDFRSDSAGFVYCKGKLNFNTSSQCISCQKSTPSTHTINLDITWRPPFESHVPKDTLLSASDLDTYFIENCKVDFGQYIYDTILCDLPSPGDRSLCENCAKSTSNSPASKQKNSALEDAKSPFSKLADLFPKKS